MIDRFALAVVWLLAMTQEAHAVDAGAEAAVILNTGLSSSVDNSGPIVATASLSGADAKGFVFADLSTDTLRASITAPTNPLSAGVSSVAIAKVDDTLRFGLPAVGVTAQLHWTFQGTFSASAGNLDLAELVIGMVPLSNLSLGGSSTAFAASDCASVPTTFQGICQQGPIVGQSGVASIRLGADQFHFNATLVTTALRGDTVNFQDTVQFWLELPEGVTYTSTSGVLLAAAPPIASAVPEPSSYVFVLSGLCLVPLLMRTKRRAPVNTYRFPPT